MNEKDGKSDLIGAITTENGSTSLIVSGEDTEENQNAVEVCPVQVISIKEL
jgi:ferredoxin